MIRFKIILTAILVLFLSNIYADEQAAMVRNGMYAGLQFGYLGTSYADALNRYAASGSNQAAAGSNFTVRGIAGYNFNEIYGVEIGVMNYKDSADGSSSTTTRKASMNLVVFNTLATFHLKLNDSRSWVATPKVGLAYEQGKLNYEFIGPTGSSPPWQGGNNINTTQTKDSVVPTVGVTFDHSFDSHFVMSFGYQYYFSGFSNYSDPYETPVSTLHYFNVGGIYKF